MNCLKCSSHFDTFSHIPRLLPHCGHSLCTLCVKELISANFIVCPECNQVNIAGSENDLPKNLAILTLQQEIRNKDNTLSSSQEAKLCKSHLKETQNFCLDCCEMGCIQCLLSHNKQHKVKSVEELEQHLIGQMQQLGKDFKELKLPYKLQKIQIEKAELLSSVNSYKTEIHAAFSEMKALCDKKQEEVLNFLKSLYDIEVLRLLEEEKDARNAIQRYTSMQGVVTPSKAVKEYIEFYTHNIDLFNGSFMKTIEHHKLRESKANELLRWESHYNKFKETVLKQLKSILNIKPFPVSSTVGIKSISKSSRDQTRYYQSKTQLRIKHPAKQEGDNLQNIPPPHKTDIAVSNYTSCRDNRTVLTYGGYTDQGEDSKASGLEVYGSKKVYEKYAGCVGHVKFGVLESTKGLIIFGGKVDNKRIDYIFLLSSLREGFKIAGRLVKGKSGFGFCKMDGSFFVVGGNDGEISSSCHQYDIHSLELRREIQSLQAERDELTLTNHKDEIYAIGGYNGKSQMSLRSVEVYSADNNEWLPINDLIHPRRSHCSISVPGGLFVVGGYDGMNYLASVERLDEESGQWEEVLQLMHPRCTFGIAPHEQGFLVLGGFAKTPTDSCEVCSTKSLKSRQADPLLCKRFMHSSILLQSFKL